MAVPVIAVKAVTKATNFTLKTKSNSGSMGTSTTYAEETALRIPAVVDGDKVFLFWENHSGSSYDETSVRIVGATSGTVIHEFSSHLTTGRNEFGVTNLVKTTGTTEDLAVQYRCTGTQGVHSTGSLFSGKSTGADLNWVQVNRQTGTTYVKATVQIDSIDVACIGRQEAQMALPSVGYVGSTRDLVKRTYTPNKMFNELAFICSRSHGASYDANDDPFMIMYTFTGKELTMS
tara:strand:+ start:338 stop:1036 length:699 start_codon:yes stop_codon:yes gene_type:complete